MPNKILIAVSLVCLSLVGYTQEFALIGNEKVKFDVFAFYNANAEKCYESGNYDSAIIYHEYSLILANKYGLDQEKCFALKEIGGFYELKGDYPKALEYLFKGLSLSEEKNLRNLEAAININIGIVYFNLKEGEKAISYYNKALRIGEEEKDTLLISKSLNNLGNANMTLMANIDEAENIFNKSVSLAKLINYETGYMVGLNNLCQIYISTGREDKALEATNSMLEEWPNNAYVYYNLANLYRQNNEQEKALNTFLKSLQLADYELELKQVLLQDISDVYAEKEDFAISLLYYKKYVNLKDSVHSNDQAKYVLELEARYENLKKEKEISELKTQSLKSKRINTIIAASGIIVLLVLGFIILIFFNKKKLAAHKIKVLENEKIIVAANSALDGEEKERLRLSRELHDGLGGILSGIKLSLANSLDDNIINAAQKLGFEKSYNLVVNSITELKRVSNALLPETLLNLGLNTAIKSYCDSFRNQTNSFELTYSFFGKNLRFAKYFELSVYRLAQEIINNAIKHASASEISVQLIIEEQRLFLGIQDNGKGFDLLDVAKKGGLGLPNLKQRAEVYGGRVEIVSELGNGTEVIIEFVNLFDNKIVYDKSSDS